MVGSSAVSRRIVAGQVIVVLGALVIARAPGSDDI